MIYLDNSASTFKKPKSVIDSVCKCLSTNCANSGRSGHTLSLNAAIEIEKTRLKLQDFFNADNVIFTKGCTEALNIALFSVLETNAHIIITENEHNSVVRPLYSKKDELNLKIDVAKCNNNQIGVKEIEKLVCANTKLVCVNHISNVNGDFCNIKDIGAFCKKNNIIFMVDGAQSVGHVQIDMHKCNIDLLAIAPHKALYAPQGVGALCFSNNVEISPIIFGGTGTGSDKLTQPTDGLERLESGTSCNHNIAGLDAGLCFVKQNFEMINQKIDNLCTYLTYQLSQIEGVKVYNSIENSFGVVAFNIKNFGSTEVAQILDDKYKICVRGGLQCAPLKHQALGTTIQGIVRASISFFNSQREIEKLVFAVKQICKKQNL